MFASFRFASVALSFDVSGFAYHFGGLWASWSQQGVNTLVEVAKPRESQSAKNVFQLEMTGITSYRSHIWLVIREGLSLPSRMLRTMNILVCKRVSLHPK